MKNIFLIGITLMLPSLLLAQSHTLTGDVINTDGAALPFATVALLNPLDSTLSNFSITNNSGHFEIKQVAEKNYILQVAFIGYRSFYRNLTLPLVGGDELGTLVLQSKAYDMSEAKITGERIPILVKQDTVEYNAAAFKTKPDAVAEDLLRKLPGLEVDRAGNVKAMGENVNRVLVDGKEFFSTDPKVATKNLPAESIDKVQLYDKKTDEAELLGIDESEYDKTINFVLKDNMKQAIFGDVSLGVGTGAHYQGRGKVYRFTDKHQFALLGMANNVNKPGFSFQDYLDFNGGMRNMMSSGGGMRITIGDDNSLPVDFGQDVTGYLTSGAGGINYSYEIAKNNRINISYLGNGSKKEQLQTSYSNNFTNEKNFEQNSDETSNGNGFNHLFNLGWRNKAGNKQHFMINGIASVSNNHSNSHSITSSYADLLPVNNLTNSTSGFNNQLNTTLEGSFLRKGAGNWRMFKLNSQLKYARTLKKSDWENLTQFTGQSDPLKDAEYLENHNSQLQFYSTITSMRKIAGNWFFEPSLSGGINTEILDQAQGINLVPKLEIDSVSPLLRKDFQWLKPGLSLKMYTKKTRIRLGIEVEAGVLSNLLNDSSTISRNIYGILPDAGWEYEYRTGRRLMMNYTGSLITPQASQLLPLISTSNPLMVYYGNRNLKPERVQNLNLSWFLFDQFSFTSFFSSLDASYTTDKINRSIQVAQDLKQTITLVNVPDDYRASLYADFSTPIRPLGIKISISGTERWNKGKSWVNSLLNENTNLTHKASLRLDNRKKDKWDAEIGGDLSFTQASYSIQKELNNNYFSYSGFGEIRYTPNDKWHFRITGDITNYAAQNFGKAVTIPLLGAEVNYYFLANKRGMITLEANDMLNKNTGVSRISELNYLRETHSSILGRYVMFSFKYKLNKFGNDQGGIHFETRH